MSQPKAPPGDDELDFTRPAPPAPPPAKHVLASAQKEAASVGPQLRKSGFYIAIARRATTKVPPRNGERYALLVVEDDPDLSNLLAEIFSLSGFEVRRASNRAEINVEMNRTPLADLILLDIKLPDADGLQILTRLRAHAKFAKMPVILMTGKAEAADVKSGLALGADGYVSKPFKMSALLTAVNTVLGNL